MRPARSVPFSLPRSAAARRLIEKLGETEASHAVERCLARMERAVLGCAGRIVKQLNGELLALFDRADEAAQAAIDMQVRVADLPPISGVKLAVRTAFSCGTIFREETVFAAPSSVARPPWPAWPGPGRC